MRCVVINDASEDDTAAVARAAGAEVITFARHRGLGAAVRVGLADGVAHGSAAIAFCDADGEYAPEELDALVAPILEGAADYVIGSRFLRTDARMLVHRRFGNRLLTAAMRAIARTALTDGQSGYRAVSPAAACAAEIIHDYNYAQVLTLDLLSKGAAYTEVPISYAFRTSGRSFIRLGSYLRNVGPAVLRQLRTSQRRAPADIDAANATSATAHYVS